MTPIDQVKALVDALAKPDYAAEPFVMYVSPGAIRDLKWHVSGPPKFRNIARTLKRMKPSIRRLYAETAVRPILRIR